MFAGRFPDPPEIPGTTADPSNQGTNPPCTSHAVGKAVVECLDELSLDCSQDAVITALINLKQSNFHRQWPTIFDSGTVITLSFYREVTIMPLSSRQV